MSETRAMPKIPAGIISEEQLAKIAGGDCSITDVQTALANIQQTYDGLVDFTSYVIERVATSLN